MKINKKYTIILLVSLALLILVYFILSFIKQARIVAREVNNNVTASTTENWVKFVPEKGDFIVSFPENPTVKNVVLDQVMPSTSTTLNTYQYLWQGANNDDYSVVENRYSSNLRANTQELVEYYYSITLKQLSSAGYKLVNKQNLLYKNLYPTIDFEMNGPLHSKGRIIVTDQKTFYVLVHDYYTQNDTNYNYFLDSFALRTTTNHSY